jgi:hypothetical protein
METRREFMLAGQPMAIVISGPDRSPLGDALYSGRRVDVVAAGAERSVWAFEVHPTDSIIDAQPKGEAVLVWTGGGYLHIFDARSGDELERIFVK